MISKETLKNGVSKIIFSIYSFYSYCASNQSLLIVMLRFRARALKTFWYLKSREGTSSKQGVYFSSEKQWNV